MDNRGLDKAGRSWYTKNVMADLDPEAVEERHKRTVWLLGAAGISLLLPLLGLIFLRASESRNIHPPTNTIMFDRREPGESKAGAYKASVEVKPLRAAAPVKENSSLRFVKGSGDYFKDKEAETPQVLAAEPIAPPAPAKAPVKESKKSFNMPKLQGVKTFNSFKKGSPQPAGGQEDILKNLPPGAENNPEVLKYLKSR